MVEWYDSRIKTTRVGKGVVASMSKSDITYTQGMVLSEDGQRVSKLVATEGGGMNG